MTKAELLREIADRGYDFVSSSRRGQFIDRAYQAICSRYPWSFLEADKTGEAPIAFTDLRKILSVTDTTGDRELRGVDRRWLVSTFPDLPGTTKPEYWYLENDTLKAYPTGGAELAIRYLRRPTALGESDEPLIPSEWQYLLVDRAIVDCLKDSDEYEEARALRIDVEEGLREMVHGLMNRNLQGPGFIQRTGTAQDYW